MPRAAPSLQEEETKDTCKDDELRADQVCTLPNIVDVVIDVADIPCALDNSERQSRVDGGGMLIEMQWSARPSMWS